MCIRDRIDTVSPTVVLDSGVENITSLAAIPVSVFFSEPVTGFSESDLTVTGAIVEGFVSDISQNQQFGSHYIFTLRPIAAGGGNITVDIASNVAEDAAGNGNTAATQFAVFFDGMPSLTIRNQGIATAPFTAIFEFSEPVQGFDISDIVLTNGAASNFIRVSELEYRVTISPIVRLKQVIIDVPMDAANDADGIGILAARRNVLGTFPIGMILPLLED